MSAIKNYLENIVTMATDAICEECPDPYYKRFDRAEIEEMIMNDIVDDGVDETVHEMLLYVSDFCEDIADEFPKSFSAICAMIPMIKDSRYVTDWFEIVTAADEHIAYNACVEAYEEYHDMGDPIIDEAKEWIRSALYEDDYAGLLSDIESVIEDYELDEASNPKTFFAKHLLESLIS